MKDSDVMTWDHEDGVAKLIRVSRDEIDEGSDEPDAWDLLWIQASTNLRRVEIRLDSAYSRPIDTGERDQVELLLATAPKDAAEILRPWVRGRS